MTIKSYKDHTANERTFLAWVRTAIALMAFGFVVEKFDLFLRYTVQSKVPSPAHISSTARGEVVGTISGLALVLFGGVIIILSTFRFHRDAKAIDREDCTSIHRGGIDITLAILLVLLALALCAYMVYTAFSAS